MIMRLQLVIWTCVAVLADVAASGQRHWRVLRSEPDRGAGRGSLEEILLAVGGVMVAGLVVAAIAAAINGKLGELQ